MLISILNTLSRSSSLSLQTQLTVLSSRGNRRSMTRTGLTFTTSAGLNNCSDIGVSSTTLVEDCWESSKTGEFMGRKLVMFIRHVFFQCSACIYTRTQHLGFRASHERGWGWTRVRHTNVVGGGDPVVNFRQQSYWR